MRALATTQLKPRIIVLTNYDLPEYKNAAIALGATHFLDKAGTTAGFRKYFTKSAKPTCTPPGTEGLQPAAGPSLRLPGKTPTRSSAITTPLTG